MDSSPSKRDIRIFAKTMRRAAVAYARRRLSGKGGEGTFFAQFGDRVSEDQCAQWIQLDEALERLSALSPQRALVVELRFFGGAAEDEIAEALDVTIRTVKRDWHKAKAWLYGAISQ
jgi:DNA-directed RNA polymerase specialized sigma24 family protein